MTESLETVEPKPQSQEEMRAEITNDVLKTLGLKSLKESQEEKTFTEVKEPVGVEVPTKIIFEIKGINDENHKYNGAYIAGKVVGKHGFNLTQQVANRNGTFERENDYYVTGLEPEFYENDSRLTPEALAKRLEDIRIAKAYLEKKYGVSMSPKNYKFWSARRFKVDDLGLVYHTNQSTGNADNDPLIIYYVTLAGGFEDIATSFESAKQWNKVFYLTVRQDETKRNFGDKKSRIQANTLLDNIMNTWKKEDQLYLLYSLETKTQHGFVIDTPVELIIDELLDFIEGKNFNTDKLQKPSEFIDAVKTFEAEPDLGKMKGLFNAAFYFGIINVDGKSKSFLNRQTGTNYGNSMETAIKFLMSPKNLDELADIKKRVNAKWKS